ncbi:MAG: ABC transporter ATP-binding protein [Paracoccaceae bacterium]|jgi:ABC-type multidrug transport system fused ATPase/permease subunit|nr:ABC transporter ATP-binding protein [Paracoccaceae bacterium]
MSTETEDRPSEPPRAGLGARLSALFGGRASEASSDGQADEADRREQLFTIRDRDNIVWFWNSYLKKRTPWLFVVLGMIMVQGVVYQQFLALTESGLRVIFEEGDFSDLVRVCAIVFGLFVVRAGMSYLVPRLSVFLASNAVQELRHDLINRVMMLDLAYFERTKPGDLILRLVLQAQQLSVFVGQGTVGAVRDAVTILIVSGYLIYKSATLFLATVVILPAIVLLMQYVSHRIKDVQRKAENAMGAYMGGIEEMANGMRTVKISNQEENEKGRLRKATEDIKDLALRLQAAQALVVPTIDLASAITYVLVIGGGGWFVLKGTSGMDGAAIITYLLGLVLIFDPARMLAQFFAKLQANLIILNSVRELYEEVPTITDTPGATDDFDVAGDIRLRNVRFSYSPDVPLFDGLDMTVPGGKTTAVVGATGSGKTTVLSLMTRLYDVEGGEVTIGGKPIRDIRIRALRGAFSVVAQDIVIFNASIWENIRYVKPEATEAEIWAAAEAAEIADLIHQRGDAPLGPKGSQLSGGQKQRIAIARAFLRSAPILLLDEATSALDQQTEDKVKAALARLGKDKTTIIVAHRLSAVTHADWIYVLDAGRIVEEGRHADLMAKRGLYAGMYEAQKGGYE